MSDGFKINKAYADRYNIWRQKEELQKLKDRYGDDYEDSSSSSESEDEQQLSEKFDKGWLKAYSALKSNDASLYKKDVKFYEDESGDSSESSSEEKEGEAASSRHKKKKEKPMFLKDYERKVILEKGGIIDEDSGEEDEQPSGSGETLGYYQEQENLRKSIAAATEKSDENSSDEDDDLLKPREKSRDEKDREEEDYLDWLKGQKDTETDQAGVDQTLVPLKEFWGKPDLDAGEKFLRNYILNKQYIDKDGGSVPTYDELVDDEDEDLSEDEELLTLQDKFERKHNFRYEEPGATEIQSFPREMEDSLRQKDSKRKDRREIVKDRKTREKEVKKEELKQLKNLKRQEILDKIERLKQITGNSELGFDEKELEEEFDPQKHDDMMKQYFNDTYYDEGEGEETKPEFEMSDDEELWDNWTGEGEADQPGAGTEKGDQEDYDEPYADDPDFVMDADYDPLAAREKKKKKSRKKSKLAEALLKEKPVFDPDAKSFEEYFDEYYKLDFEDIVGDMPTRFRYRKVPANDFGLSAEEILNARDKELNQWVSIKKMSQYRTEEEEMRDVRGFASKGKNTRKKQNILTSLFDSGEAEDGSKSQTGEQPLSKGQKRKMKKRNKQQATATVTSTTDTADKSSGKDVKISQGSPGKKKQLPKDLLADSASDEDSPGEEITEKKHKKKRKHESEADASQDSGIGNDTKPGKHKLDNDDEEEEESVTVKKMKTETADKAAESGKKKKKKKKKADQEDIESDTAETGMETTDTNVMASDEAGGTGDKVLDKKAKKALKKKRQKEKKRQEQAQKLDMTEDRLKAYGINPHRYKYMSKQDMFSVKPRKDKSSKRTLE